MPELVDPADRLIHVQLPALLEAIDAADRALEELRDGRREWPSATLSMPPTPISSEPNRYFDRQAPSRTPAPAPTAGPRRSIAPIAGAWGDLRERLVHHTKRASRIIVPSCQKLATHPRLKDDVRKLLVATAREHVELGELVATVRREAGFAPPVRRELLAVCAAYDLHCRTEEAELFPQSLGEQATGQAAQNVLTGEDVTRRLRDTLPPAPQRAEAPTGGLSKLMRLFRKG